MLDFTPKTSLKEYDDISRQAIMITARAKQNMIAITLTDEELERIDKFAKAKAQAKYGEYNHIDDDDDEYKRSFTGMLGEVALEKHFGVNFVDWSIGNSSNYNVSDLIHIGYKIGIKTVEFGKLPVVYKKSYYPELICVRRDQHTIILCGLAMQNVLDNNLDIKFVLSRKLRNAGRKSAFTGFDKLIKIDKLTDLDPYNTYNKDKR